MNKFVFLFFGLLLLLFSCTSPDHSETSSVQKENSSVFPVTEFLKGQLNKIENSPVTPLKVIIADDGLMDSVWISRDSLRGFAEPFLTPVIDSASLSAYFDGELFLDHTINAITFTYDANRSLPENISLRTIDVYADPDLGNITKVYLLKEKYIDEIRTKVQLTWKTDEWCSIRTITQKNEDTPVIKEEKVTWNFD